MYAVTCCDQAIFRFHGRCLEFRQNGTADLVRCGTVEKFTPEMPPRSLRNRIWSALPPSLRVKAQDSHCRCAARLEQSELGHYIAAVSVCIQKGADNGTFQSLIPRLTSTRHNADYVTQIRLRP
jgi:hypothetical protein